MSALTFDCGDLSPNTTYILLVDGYQGDSGTAYLTITFDTPNCDIYGCTDESACNYDEAATVENNSCEFTSCACLGDFDGSGTITLNDLSILLGDFECQTNCLTDINYDGVTSSLDITLFLSIFGSLCP